MAFAISLVQYLNSAPLGWGFTHGPLRNRAIVMLSTPAECADQLREGGVDAGLIPVVEYQRIAGLRVLPGISIASVGRTRSVLLLSRVPAPRISSLALDSSSRTSAVLVRLLLGRLFGITPRCDMLLPDLPAMLGDHDAALVIGDPALEISRAGLHVYDLGELWARLTGLPFVYAFWAVRPSPEAERMASLFEDSRRYGLRHLKEISAHYASGMRLTAAAIQEYLTLNIDFGLGPRHEAGLELFYRWAAEMGLLEEVRPLEYLEAARPVSS